MTNEVVMRRGLLRVVLCLSALAILLAASMHAATAVQVGLAPRISGTSKPLETQSYPVLTAAGLPAGNASWRIVNGVGNCCENYLGVTSAGRLLSLAGGDLEFSDDRGLNWTRIAATTPLFGAEGGASAAPGGDIVGVTWDPYSGDRVVSYKFEADENRWYFLEGNLHTPFADRPWIAVLPGPFVLGGVSIPYLSVLSAGTPTKEVLFVSTDGLTYAEPSSSMLDAISNVAASRYLEPVADPVTDSLQAIRATAFVPLPGGGALAQRIVQAGCPTRILDSLLRWSCFSLPNGNTLSNDLVVDSKGWIHEVVDDDNSGFLYRISKDGGRTFKEIALQLPGTRGWESWDFKASGAAGVMALAVHTGDFPGGTDLDYVFKVSTSGADPVLTKIMQVGRGGIDFTKGINVGGAYRFDFASLVIFPDGKVATSFGDSSHRSPALAVEL